MATKDVQTLRTELATLKIRITELVDELRSVQTDVTHFKQTVADDVKRLNDKIIER